MIEDILVPFLAVGIAELGDKTQLTVLCLASKTKKYLNLLSGVILAFVVADGLAIVLGSMISQRVPVSYIKVVSGAVFIIFGIFTLIQAIKDKGEDAKCDLKTPFLSGFGLILVSEMGDKTQIASGLFAAKFNPFFVFIGVIAALILLSVAAVFLGQLIVKRVDKKTISTVAGLLFIAIGAFCFLGI